MVEEQAMLTRAERCHRRWRRADLRLALVLLPLAGAAQAQQPAAGAKAPPPAVSGPVTKVTDAASVVVGAQSIRLWGIDPGPASVLPAFDAWLRQNAGALKCEPVAMTGRHKCLTADGHDVAEVALLSGFARVGQGAMSDYRDLEDQAREQHHGFWQQQ